MNAPDNWKTRSIHRLAREIGALGEIIIDDVLFELGLEHAEVITQRQAMSFLARLQRELPPVLDLHAVIRDLSNEILPSASS